MLPRLSLTHGEQPWLEIQLVFGNLEGIVYVSFRLVEIFNLIDNQLSRDEVCKAVGTVLGHLPGILPIHRPYHRFPT